MLLKNFTSLFKENLFYKIGYGQAPNQFNFFRIVIGCFSLISFGFLLIDYSVFLAPDGLISWEVTEANAFHFEPTLSKISTWLSLSPSVTLILTSATYMVALFLIVAGRYVTISSLIAFILFRTFCIQLIPYIHGVELYQSVFLLFLVLFSGAGKIDGSGGIQSKQIAIRGLQWFLVLTYTSAGYHKALMPQWYNGEMIYSALNDPNYVLLGFSARLPAFVYSILGILTVIIEAGYGLLILIPYVRTILIIGVIGMHLFICLFMSLVPFGILLSLSNLVLWYPLLKKDFAKIKSVYANHLSSGSKKPRKNLLSAANWVPHRSH